MKHKSLKKGIQSIKIPLQQWGMQQGKAFPRLLKIELLQQNRKL